MSIRKEQLSGHVVKTATIKRESGKECVEVRRESGTLVWGDKSSASIWRLRNGLKSRRALQHACDSLTEEETAQTEVTALDSF